MEYIVNKPYPEIKVECKNKKYASLLLEDYASNISETTAIFLYIYQHFVKFNEESEFSYIIEGIAKVEMKHLEMLGKLIKLLGFKPAFKTINKNTDILIPWNSDYVDYSTDIKDMLEVNIISETKAIEKYYRHMYMIDDKYIKAIIARIIEDEKKHLECFQNLYNNLLGILE